MRTIAEIRADFEATDRQIGELLEQRLRLAGEMAEAKKASGMEVLQPSRRRQVLNQWLSNCPSYTPQSVEQIYEILHAESVRKQQNNINPN